MTEATKARIDEIIFFFLVVFWSLFITGNKEVASENPSSSIAMLELMFQTDFALGYIPVANHVSTRSLIGHAVHF